LNRFINASQKANRWKKRYEEIEKLLQKHEKDVRHARIDKLDEQEKKLEEIENVLRRHELEERHAWRER